MNNVNTNEKKLIPIRFGGSTMIGVDKTGGYPVKHGNCFSLIDIDGKSHRIVNFSYENLKYWSDKNNQKDVYVRCIPKSDSIWEICDSRIPDEWYNKEYCEVCTPLRMLPLEQRKEYIKDKKFKKVIDKINGSWWVLISSCVKPGIRKLDKKWKFELL